MDRPTGPSITTRYCAASESAAARPGDNPEPPPANGAVEEMIGAGEHVVVRWCGRGHAPASGVPLDWRETHVFTLADGMVVRVREYRDWADALVAVGLHE